MHIPIVGQFFPAGPALRAHIRAVRLDAWAPDFIVLHNTGAPTLAQRPHGLTRRHIENLADFYGRVQHWHAGPHWFVDQNGCWAFSPLSAPGVHSPSWNGRSWGVEMLGDYDREDFDAGPGARVAANAVFLLAALSERAGLDSHTLRLHREDPKTSHKDCPGRAVSAAAVIARVHALRAEWGAAG